MILWLVFNGFFNLFAQKKMWQEKPDQKEIIFR